MQLVSMTMLAVFAVTLGFSRYSWKLDASEIGTKGGPIREEQLDPALRLQWRQVDSGSPHVFAVDTRALRRGLPQEPPHWEAIQDHPNHAIVI